MEFAQKSLKTLVEKYDRPVPRYTSYPTATQFRDDISLDTLHTWLKKIPSDKPLSIYIHLPFCPSLCWYCGCNMRVTHSRNLMQSYMTALQNEIDLVVQKLPKRKMKVSTVHLGGGTPNYYSPESLLYLFHFLKSRFEIVADAEISLEIDPRHFNTEMAHVLKRASINRVSLGVQDTNPLVQEAIGRNQSYTETSQAFSKLRDAGITAINVDLIYGLPLQTITSVTQTAHEIAQLRPSRIAIYGYAHVPWMKPHQKLLEHHPIPGSMERMELFTAATDVFKSHGYIPVGIDHFALPDDSLVQASQQKQLHRNFMGYTTDNATTMLAFGVSAISSFPQGYSQNTTSVKDYIHQVGKKTLPLWKGLELSPSDRCTSKIIESLLCNFEANIPEIIKEHAIQPETFKISNLNLHQMEADGLITTGDQAATVHITEHGKPFARVIASCFDHYLKSTEQRHSRL